MFWIILSVIISVLAVSLLVYTVLEVEEKDITIGQFIIFVVPSIIPIMNLFILAFAALEVLDRGKFFDKVLFKAKVE